MKTYSQRKKENTLLFRNSLETRNETGEEIWKNSIMPVDVDNHADIKSSEEKEK